MQVLALSEHIQPEIYREWLFSLMFISKHATTLRTNYRCSSKISNDRLSALLPPAEEVTLILILISLWVTSRLRPSVTSWCFESTTCGLMAAVRWRKHRSFVSSSFPLPSLHLEFSTENGKGRFFRLPQMIIVLSHIIYLLYKNISLPFTDERHSRHIPFLLYCFSFAWNGKV